MNKSYYSFSIVHLSLAKRPSRHQSTVVCHTRNDSDITIHRLIFFSHSPSPSFSVFLFNKYLLHMPPTLDIFQYSFSRFVHIHHHDSWVTVILYLSSINGTKWNGMDIKILQHCYNFFLCSVSASVSASASAPTSAPALRLRHPLNAIDVFVIHQRRRCRRRLVFFSFF